MARMGYQAIVGMAPAIGAGGWVQGRDPAMKSWAFGDAPAEMSAPAPEASDRSGRGPTTSATVRTDDANRCLASPRTRERWQVFVCAAHAERLADDPECRDVGPLDDAAMAELADRRERWQAALDGKGWRPPQPMRCRRSSNSPGLARRGHVIGWSWSPGPRRARVGCGAGSWLRP